MIRWVRGTIFNILKKIPPRYQFFILDLFFLSLIFLMVRSFLDFKFGEYLLTGDFRFHIYKELIGDQFLGLISEKFSNNNFIFIPFYSLYYLLSFFPYHLVLAYIFFGMPVLIFFSVRYVLIRVTSFSYDSFPKHFVLSSLAFYVATSPALFERFGHFTILHSVIAFPLFIYFLHEYFNTKDIITWHPFIIAALVFLGAMTPQTIVVYFVCGLLLSMLHLFFFISHQSFFRRVQKVLIIAMLAIVSLSHILYPIIIGYGQTKSRLESPTTSGILSSLSRESSVFSALSGTNYYSQEIVYPFEIGAGFVIFFVSFLLFSYASRNKLKDQLALLFLLLGLVIISGYRSFPWIFDFFSATPLRDFLWIIKDPNMYYQFFAVVLVIFSARIIFKSRNLLKSKHLFIFGGVIILLNIFTVIFSDHDRYREFYTFVDVPNEYITLSSELKNDTGRNVWLPYDVYVSKTFAPGVKFFPTPAFWLTQNKELTSSTKEYEDLLEILQVEMYEKGCQNAYLIDWIIATQNLNVIVDRNSIDNKILGVNDVESKLHQTEECLKGLPNVYLNKSFGKIDVYKTRTKIRDDVYAYSGTPKGLNNFLKDNSVNVVYSQSDQENSKKMDGSFAILNESYDENWRNSDGKKPVHKVNFSSMAFEDSGKMFYYRGESDFQSFVFWQKIILAAYLLLGTVLIFKEKRDGRL